MTEQQKATLEAFVLLVKIRGMKASQVRLVEEFNRDHPEHDAQDCEMERVHLAQIDGYLQRMLTESIDADEFREWFLKMSLEGRQAHDRLKRREGLRGLLEVEDALGMRGEDQ